MRITHDTEADAMLIYLNEKGQFQTNRVINDRVILSLDEAGQVIAIELLNVSRFVDDPQKIVYQDITHPSEETSH